jgi:hypothetical protein
VAVTVISTMFLPRLWHRWFMLLLVIVNQESQRHEIVPIVLGDNFLIQNGINPFLRSNEVCIVGDRTGREGGDHLHVVAARGSECGHYFHVMRGD